MFTWPISRPPLRIGWFAFLIVVAALAFAAVTSGTAQAAANSQNVALVPDDDGDSDYGGDSGGTLPTSGFPDGYAPSFTNLDPEDIADGTQANPLTAFDTVVLVQLCSVGDFLADADFKSRLDGFIAGGGKLLIWDSECAGSDTPDYSNFVYPFTSDNPGANGSDCDGFNDADCFLNDVEENTLGTDDIPASPFFIDTFILAEETDAVGDANVFTTQNPAWCVDMVAKNISGDNESVGITGPVQSYAHYGSGLIVYNGLDMDDLDGAELYDNTTGEGAFERVWLFQLLQPFAPDGLPCGVVATGITLSPQSATNTLGQNHTVTATVRDPLNNPIVGRLVNFTITSGPNAGNTGSATTDAIGNATFTYTSQTVGTDEIQASFNATPPDCQAPQIVRIDLCEPDIRLSNVVTKTWVNPAPVAAQATARLSVAKCAKTKRSATVTVANASNITKVDFYLNGKKVKTDTAAPYKYSLTAKQRKSGTHRVTTIVTLSDGRTIRTTKRVSGCKVRTTKRVSEPRFTG